MRKEHLILTTVILISVAALGAFLLMMCRDHRVWNARDSWYAPPPGSIDLWTWPEITSRERIIEVQSDCVLEAERMLAEVCLVEITLRKARELTHSHIVLPRGCNPYLVRGVALEGGTGQFSIQHKDRSLVVKYGTLGHGPLPMKKQPLLLLLDQKPDVVYCTCSGAE